MNDVSSLNPTEKNAVYSVVASTLLQAEPLKKKRPGFTPDTLLADIKMDSLETLSVAMDLEEHYSLFIPDEDIEAFKTVGDIVRYLEQRLQQRAECQAQDEAQQQETLEAPATEANNAQPAPRT